MDLIQPLDLEMIFVNIFAGSPVIFAFFSILFVSTLAAYFKMSNFITMIMFVLFGIIMANYLGGLYVLLILVTGMAVFYGLSRIIK